MVLGVNRCLVGLMAELIKQSWFFIMRVIKSLKDPQSPRVVLPSRLGHICTFSNKCCH